MVHNGEAVLRGPDRITHRLLVKWLPRNSGQQIVLLCGTMRSCLVCRGPLFQPNSPSVAVETKCVLHTWVVFFIRSYKQGLPRPFVPHMHNLCFILLRNRVTWGMNGLALLQLISYCRCGKRKFLSLCGLKKGCSPLAGMVSP